MTDQLEVAVVEGGILIFTSFKTMSLRHVSIGIKKSIYFHCGNKICWRRL